MTKRVSEMNRDDMIDEIIRLREENAYLRGKERRRLDEELQRMYDESSKYNELLAAYGG